MSILIIGGGIAGITAAIYLGEQGHKVTLIEREEELGGKLNNLFSIYGLDILPKDFVSQQISKLKEFSNINVFTSAELVETKGYVRNFNSKLRIKNSEFREVKHGAIIIATGIDLSMPKMQYESQKIISHTQLEDYMENSRIIPKTFGAFGTTK